MIKAGLIGIGGMGYCHFCEYQKISGVEVVAVADVRVDMATEKVNGKANVYASMDELLANEEIDMIDICTPSYMHTDLAVKALEAGKHVLCEKPMSISSDDTTRMIEAAEKSGKLFMVAHVVRFMKAYEYLKSVIDSGELGKPVHIDMKRISAIPTWSWEDWMRDEKLSGGVGIDLSIHDLDFAQYVFGQPNEVSGVYSPIKNNSSYLVSNLVYDGFDITVTGTWFNCDIPFKAEYLAVFENGYVESVGGRIIKNGEEIEFESGNVSEDTGINISGADGYSDEIIYFTDCIRNGVKPEKVSPESSQNSIKLIERIIENSIKL